MRVAAGGSPHTKTPVNYLLPMFPGVFYILYVIYNSMLLNFTCILSSLAASSLSDVRSMV